MKISMTAMITVSPIFGKNVKNETHFKYGIGVIIDGETEVSELDFVLDNGYTIWETNPMDYVVFKCFGRDGGCIAETWSKFFKEFVPQTGYTQTDDTDYEIYFETIKRISDGDRPHLNGSQTTCEISLRQIVQSINQHAGHVGRPRDKSALGIVL